MSKYVSRRHLLRGIGAGALGAAGVVALAACGETQIVEVEKIVVKEVPVEVIKEVTVEKIVTIEAMATSIDAGFIRPTDGTPKYGGRLTTAFGVTLAHFDMHQGGGAHVMSQMYNNLVRFNPIDGLRSIIPDLATSWEVSPDGKKIVFQLRQGVDYHDGTRFSSADVEATFNRIINPPQGIISPNKTRLAVVESVKALDESSVEFNLTQPAPFLLEVLSATNMFIYSKSSLEENDFDLKKVIAPGTGFMKFSDHKVAERWLFVRNDNYWDADLPYVDEIEMLHVPAWTDRGTAVLSGQADMSWNVSFETWDEGRTRDNLVANQFPSLGAYIVWMNSSKAPLDSADVRRAVHLATDRPGLFQAFRTQEPLNYTRWFTHGSQYATPPSVVQNMPAYRADTNGEDAAEAQRLMANAGFADGVKGLEILVASVAPHAEILAPAFQDMIRRNAGIETNIRTTERALLVEELQKGDYDFVLGTQGFPTPDPTIGWAENFRTGGSQNHGGYSNPAFDAIVDELMVEPDVAKRQALVDQGQDLLDANPPWITIGFTNHLPMWNKKVKGLSLDKRQFAEWGRMTTVWLDE